MATSAETFIPKGFTAGRHPMISEALAQRMARLPARSGPQRLAVVLAAKAKQADVDAFLEQDGMWRPRPKAPGVLEIDVLPPDIAKFSDRKDLFQWIDAATRLFGKTPAEGTVTAEVAASDLKAAEKSLKAAGATVSGKSGTMITAKIAAEKLGALLKEPGIEAIEVK